MAKTLIDIDEALLVGAQEALKTTSEKDTVNEALREVAAMAARRRGLERLRGDEMSDLLDDEIMRRAWQ